MDSPRFPDGRRPGATVLLLLLAGLLAFAAYRVCAIAIADHYARSSPDRALRLVGRHPEALLTAARLQLAAGRDVVGAGTARKLLRDSPAEGEGFAVLARVAERSGDDAGALRLMQIAARRNPRDLSARGWLAEHAIARGDYASGLDQLDAVMRLSPMHTDVLVPVIAELAKDPEFASIVAARLAGNPRWGGMLVAEIKADPAAADGLAGFAVGTRSAPPLPASARVGDMHLRDRIAGVIDPRGLIPAGR